MNNSKLLYVVDKECPLCEKKFTTTRVRNNLQLIKQDTDFCSYYTGINPYYYAVWVCSHCGYAMQDTYFGEPIMPAAAEKLRSFLNSRQVQVDFGGIRTREQAIATYKLAAFYGEMIQPLASRSAGLWIKLAWLFREADQADEEQYALGKAIDYYERALLKERLPIGPLTEVTVQFLLGELFRRTGRIDEAVIYLGRLASDPQAKSEKRIVELARSCWQLARDAKKAQDRVVQNEVAR